LGTRRHSSVAAYVRRIEHRRASAQNGVTSEQRRTQLTVASAAC
jgi:hypothetical protein